MIRPAARSGSEPASVPNHFARAHERHGHGLGLPVHLVHGVAEHVVPRGRGARADRGAGHHNGLQVGQVQALAAGLGDHIGDHRGHREEVSDPVVAQRLRERGRVEPRRQNVHAPGQPDGQEQVARAVRDRPDVQAHVTDVGGREHVEPVAGGAHPGPVRVGDALGPAGRAGRVPDDEHVVEGDVQVRVGGIVPGEPGLVAGVPDQDAQPADRVREGGDLVGVLLRHHDDLAAGVPDHVRVRLGGVAPVQRHAHQVGNRGAEVEVDRLDAVVLEDRDPVPRGQAEPGQGVGQAQAAFPGLPVGQLAVAAADRGQIAVEPGRSPHGASDIQHAASRDLGNPGCGSRHIPRIVRTVATPVSRRQQCR
jgi:hypothetical protein